MRTLDEEFNSLFKSVSEKQWKTNRFLVRKVMKIRQLLLSLRRVAKQIVKREEKA